MTPRIRVGPVVPRNYREEKMLRSLGIAHEALPPRPKRQGEPPEETVELRFHDEMKRSVPKSALQCSRPYERQWVEWHGKEDGIFSMSTQTMRLASALPWPVEKVDQQHGVAYYRRAKENHE